MSDRGCFVIALLLTQVALAACGRVSNVDGADAAVDSGEVDPCMPVSESAAIVCSMQGAARDVVFKNNCRREVDVWWVDYSCTEVFAERLGVGGSYRAASFVSHPFRVRTTPATGAPGAMKGELLKDFGPLPAGTGDHMFAVP